MHPAEIDLGLDRISQVASRMDLDWLLEGKADPDACSQNDEGNGEEGEEGEERRKRPLVLTIAGTNGKGSCAKTCETVLQELGVSVGVYTSPHFLHFNERIRFNGQPATDDAIVGALERVEAARGKVSLTYFEFTTLAALQLFAQNLPEVLVLEVGLGGRLDAVNLVDPDIAIITSIAIDHESWLGGDRETIGAEKAGILRPGIPLVYGEVDMPQSIHDLAQAGGNPVYQLGRQFQASNQSLHILAHTGGLTFELPEEPMLYPANIAAGLQALALAGLLGGPDFEPQRLARACARQSLPGRFQRLVHVGVEIILDVAHNNAGLELLAARLGGLPPKTTCLVFGAMADKSLDQGLAALSAVVDNWYTASLPVDRACSAMELAEKILGLTPETNVRSCASPRTALSAILDSPDLPPKEQVRIVVAGSFWTVADVLPVVQV